VTVTATDANAGENGDSGTFTITRTGKHRRHTISELHDERHSAKWSRLSDAVWLGHNCGWFKFCKHPAHPVDDTTVEGNETAVLTLAANSTYTIGSPSSATVTIADNDQPPLQQ